MRISRINSQLLIGGLVQVMFDTLIATTQLIMAFDRGAAAQDQA